MLKTAVVSKVIKKAGGVKQPKITKLKLVKPFEKKKWLNLTKADCLKSIKTASHLSSKSVNSNAAAVGVRLNPEHRLPLDFVAVSTMDAEKIPLDYVVGATEAAPLKQITSVLNGSHLVFYTEIEPEQVSMIETLRPLLSAGASIGTSFIDPRLRQVIWPTGVDAAPWVALTPLQSSGLSEVIRARLKLESEKNIDAKSGKTTIYRSNAIFGIGGSNPQNVGQHVRSMQRPLVFDAPQEDRDLRYAYAMYYKGHLRGLAFATPWNETQAFALWRHELRAANGQKMPTSAAIRQQELDHIQIIALASLYAADSARKTLVQHQEYLNGLTSPKLDPFLRALIDPELRDRNFKKTFARKLITSIERFKYKIGLNDYVICGDGELSALISIIEQVAP